MVSLFALLALALQPALVPTPAPLAQDAAQDRAVAEWTILFYGASDNDSEQSFCPDVEALRAGIVPGAAITVLALVDRSPQYSSTARGFGEDFADTRLYLLTPERAVREDGGESFREITCQSSYEANTADAVTLRKTLRWMRERHPAKRYALVFYSHGSGSVWCPDEGNQGDFLYPAELTDVLEEQDSLDLMVFDVCLMSGVENAYQWRPESGRFGVDVMVATPMAGFPFPWQRILSRVRPGQAVDGAPAWLDPASTSAVDFGRLIVEESECQRREFAGRPGISEELRRMIQGESMTCLDLGRITAVKQRMDALARSLASDAGRELLEDVRGDNRNPRTLVYHDPNEEPYFDLHHLVTGIAEHADADAIVRARASAVREALEAAVIASFGLERYDEQGGFLPGKHGLYVILPAAQQWSSMGWYHPGVARGERSYGRYAWCADGATPGDDRIDNWFELLDAWYDEYDELGGVNRYRW